MMRKKKSAKKKLNLSFGDINVVKEDELALPNTNQQETNQQVEEENNIKQENFKLLSKSFFEKLSHKSFIPRPVYRTMHGSTKANSENEMQIYNACLYNSVSVLHDAMTLNPSFAKFRNENNETLLHMALLRINPYKIGMDPEKLLTDLRNIKNDIVNLHSTQQLVNLNNLAIFINSFKTRIRQIISDSKKLIYNVEKISDHVKKIHNNPKLFTKHKEQLQTNRTKLIENKEEFNAYIIIVSYYISNFNLDLERIKTLIKNKIDPNQGDKNNDTPLHLLVKTTGEDIAPFIKVLCENGANVNALNNKKQTPMDIALVYNNYTSAFQLREYGGDFNLYKSKYIEMLKAEVEQKNRLACILLCFKEKYKANGEHNLTFSFHKNIQCIILSHILYLENQAAEGKCTSHIPNRN